MKVSGKVRSVLAVLIEAYPNAATDKELHAACNYAPTAISLARNFLSIEYGLPRESISRVRSSDMGYILSQAAWAALKGFQLSSYPTSWLLGEEDERVLDSLSEAYPAAATRADIRAETGVVIDNSWYTAFRFRMRHAFPDDPVVLDMGDSVRLTDSAAEKIVSVLTDKSR